MSLTDVAGGFVLPVITFTTGAFASATAAANVLSGQGILIVNSTTNNGNYTTRTATQMITDSGLGLNQQWWLLLSNSGATNALTLVGGTGVTIVGTATVAAVTARLYIAQCTLVSTPTITYTNAGFSMTATAFAFGV